VLSSVPSAMADLGDAGCDNEAEYLAFQQVLHASVIVDIPVPEMRLDMYHDG